MALTPGTRVGPYEITALLGAGGMGEVYRARDTNLNRDVALKVLPANFALDKERLARLRREAQVLASLNHPNIATIHGFEDSDGVPALVLELVEGSTLSSRIAEGPIPLDESMSIAGQIADALEAAHERGIIHRDLKPANITVRPDGTVKVLDFGLAKALEPVLPTADATMSPTITSPAMTGMGMILGTAAYMSPEQAKGRPADKRSDVWAFGCVLYEMLTGRRAFNGEGVADTLAAVLRGEPDWSALSPRVPEGVHALLTHCLDKDPRHRVGDLAVARFVLRQPVGVAQSATAPALFSARRWKFVAALLATALVVALGGAAAWRLTPRTPIAPVMRFSWGVPEGQLLTTVNRRFVAISPEGTQLAYIANNRLFLRSLSDFNATEIAGTDDPSGISNPVFSPDGRSIAFASGQGRVVKRIAVSGGAATAICPFGVDLFSLAWDSTGILFSQGRDGIVRCSPSGGAPEKILSVREGEEANEPQSLLEGSALLLTIANVADGPTRWDKAQIVVHTVATGARKVIVNGGSDARYLPTGHLMYSAGGIVFAVPFDPVQQVVTGESVPVVERVMRPLGGFTGSVQLATSANGTLVYVPGPVGVTRAERVLAIADRAGTVAQLAPPPSAYEHVRASRDGARLAIGTDDGQEAIVWIYELGGKSAMRRLTFGGQNRFPIWSPDGARVAFQSDRDGDTALFVQNADGTGRIERMTTAVADEAHVPESWSPDGRHLLFSVRKGDRFSLQVLSIDDKKAVALGGIESARPISAVFSPDGRWIAHGFAPEGNADVSSRGVYVQPFPTTGTRFQVPKQLGSIDYHPVWAPDGTELFHVLNVGSGQLAAVRVMTRPALTFGIPVNLPARVTGDRTSTQMRVYDILPDGRFVGVVPPSELGTRGPVTVAAPEFRIVLNWFDELKARVPVN